MKQVKEWRTKLELNMKCYEQGTCPRLYNCSAHKSRWALCEHLSYSSQNYSFKISAKTTASESQLKVNELRSLKNNNAPDIHMQCDLNSLEWAEKPDG